MDFDKLFEISLKFIPSILNLHFELLRARVVPIFDALPVFILEPLLYLHGTSLSTGTCSCWRAM